MKMRSDTDHREQLDDFSEFMRRKLADHRLPVDDACWDEIEPRMKSHQPRLAWWAGSSVAAAVIAILFLLYPFQMEEKLNDTLQENLVSSYIDEEDITEVPVTEIASPKDEKNEPYKKLIAVVTEKQSSKEEDKQPEIAEDKKEEETAPEEVQDKKGQAVKSPEKQKKQASEKESKRLDLYTYESEKYHFTTEGKSRKQEGKWALNAGFGTGGHISLGSLSDNYPMSDNMNNSGGSLPPPVIPPTFNDNGTVSPGEYEVDDCSLPVSFGVTVRKDFNRYIGLETGLVYTYLSSRLSKSGTARYESKLDLHYLGIPVNLVVRLWQNPRWSIYLSGGIMAEKGLRAKQMEDRFWQTEYFHTTSKKRINGMQWSLNMAAGVSYHLYRDWSLYFEPRISRYFDNNQPVSIRTENTVIFGLGAGLRYEF